MTTAQETQETRGRRRAAPPKRPVPKGRGRTVRTPSVLQMEAVECGAASLAMVLGHYGRHVPLEELRIACGVSRDGSRASNLLKAARGYGLTAKGMQMDLAALADVQGPAILFWEFNHYVVYDGMGRRFGRRGIYINDPAKGRRFVPMEEFDGSFTGVVLILEPGDGFERGGRKPGVLGAMPARLRGTAGTMPAAVLASLLLVAVGAAVPALSRQYIDMFLIGGQTSLLIGLLAIALSGILGIAAGAAAGYLGGWVDTLVSRLLEAQMSLPLLLMLLLVVALFGPSVPVITLVIAIAQWPEPARLTRALVLVEREKPYVAAAQVLGLGKLKIIVRHIK